MPGLEGKLLLNYLNITAKKGIDQIETELLFKIKDQLLDEFDNTRQFSAEDILEYGSVQFSVMPARELNKH